MDNVSARYCKVINYNYVFAEPKDDKEGYIVPKSDTVNLLDEPDMNILSKVSVMGNAYYDRETKNIEFRRYHIIAEGKD